MVSMHDVVWGRLAGLCTMTTAALKSRCIEAGHISFHFFWRRVLDPCSEPPVDLGPWGHRAEPQGVARWAVPRRAH